MGTDTDISPRPGAPDEVLLLLGGRSEIGLALAERLVAAGHRTVVLAARRAHDLADEERRLRSSGATTVGRLEFDADDLDRHATVLAEVEQRFGVPATVVLAFGILGDQATAEQEPAAAVATVHTDYVAHVHLLLLLARRLRAVAKGRIVVFSSIAGVRARRANFVYGSAKAGLDGFTSGLRDSLAGTGVDVVIVRPGFVVGRMTAGMSPAPFSSTPDQVADAVAHAVARGRDTVWVPGALRYVAVGLRLLPRVVWRRLPR